MDLKGHDIIMALSNVDAEMIDAAEKCGKVKSGFKPIKYIAAVAVLAAIFITVWWQFKDVNGYELITEVQYVRLDDTYILTQPTESTYDSLTREEEQKTSGYMIDSGVVELELISGINNDALVPQIGIGTNGSTLLKKAIREQNMIDSEEEISYLVEIEIYVPHPEYPELGTYADSEIYEAEYRRLTEECGYDLTWIAPGGYTIPDAYVYCLSCGIIYGVLTEEEMNDFPIDEEYSYGFRLTTYDAYKFTEYPYKETYTSMEELLHHMMALKALRELGEDKKDEKNN